MMTCNLVKSFKVSINNQQDKNKATILTDLTVDETTFISHDNLWGEDSQLNIVEENCTSRNRKKWLFYLLTKILEGFFYMNNNERLQKISKEFGQPRDFNPNKNRMLVSRGPKLYPKIKENCLIP